jgi:hypothetical protein
LFERLIREPLVHFFGLGLLLFLLYAVVAPADVGDDRIVVTEAKIADLARQYQTIWNRPPTPDELNRLIDADVRSEILYREGKALGLAEDDAVIKRRVRQKYELITEEEDAGEPPSDADLGAFLAANPANFRRPPIVSFDQILIEVKGSDADIEARIAAIEKAAAAGANPATLGDPTMLPHRVEATALDLVARDFGADFAAAVGSSCRSGNGRGRSVRGSASISSGYRRVACHRCRRLPIVRAAVAREWENDRRNRQRSELQAGAGSNMMWSSRASSDPLAAGAAAADGGTCRRRRVQARLSATDRARRRRL